MSSRSRSSGNRNPRSCGRSQGVQSLRTSHRQKLRTPAPRTSHHLADHPEIHGRILRLSPYLLTELLLPTLTAGAPSRVVIVTSGAVTLAKKVFDHVEPPGGYYRFHWYGRAKLANLAYTLDPAQHP